MATIFSTACGCCGCSYIHSQLPECSRLLTLKFVEVVKTSGAFVVIEEGIYDYGCSFEYDPPLANPQCVVRWLSPDQTDLVQLRVDKVTMQAFLDVARSDDPPGCTSLDYILVTTLSLGDATSAEAFIDKMCNEETFSFVAGGTEGYDVTVRS